MKPQNGSTLYHTLTPRDSNVVRDDMNPIDNVSRIRSLDLLCPSDELFSLYLIAGAATAARGGAGTGGSFLGFLLFLF